MEDHDVCVLYVLRLAKGMSQDKATLKNNKIKPVPLSIAELSWLKASVSKRVSYSQHKIQLKYFNFTKICWKG